jgi:hypothetical protein
MVSRPFHGYSGAVVEEGALRITGMCPQQGNGVLVNLKTRYNGLSPAAQYAVWGVGAYIGLKVLGVIK